VRRRWVEVAALVSLALTLLFIAWSGVVLIGAVRENTRTLDRLGELAVGNKIVLATVHQDMQLAAERFKVVDQQLTIIELQLDAARKEKP
jgi:hypothetical protein